MHGKGKKNLSRAVFRLLSTVICFNYFGLVLAQNFALFFYKRKKKKTLKLEKTDNELFRQKRKLITYISKI